MLPAIIGGLLTAAAIPSAIESTGNILGDVGVDMTGKARRRGRIINEQARSMVLDDLLEGLDYGDDKILNELLSSIPDSSFLEEGSLLGRQSEADRELAPLIAGHQRELQELSMVTQQRGSLRDLAVQLGVTGIA